MLPGDQTKIPASTVTAAVLAGGRSSRFGTDKALTAVPGTTTPMLQRALETARQVAGRVLIISPDRPQYRDFGSFIIPDRFPGAGPGGGLVTALLESVTPWLVVLSCDQPMVRAEDLAELLESNVDHPAAAFRRDGSRFNPLPCTLAVDSCREVAIEAYQTGTHSLHGLLAACGVHLIDLAAPSPGADRLIDVDSPADLARVGELLDG